MPEILFGPYEPDRPGYRANGLQIARNVYPAAAGYRPVRKFVSSAEPLPATCLGAGSFVSPAGTSAIVAGTATALYRAYSGDWEEIGTGYSIQSGGRWRFAQFGGIAVATNGADPMTKINLETGVTAVLGGAPPKAKILAVVKDSLVGGVIDGEVNTLQWSGINNAEFWTIGENQSDYQVMPVGGEITGLFGGEVGIILQRGRVARMTYVGDNFVFQFDEISYNIGCVSPHSTAQSGNLGFFLSDNGFIMWDGAQLRPIGYERVDRTFAALYSRPDWERMSTAVDAKNNLVAWSMGDRMFVYNWVLDRWSIIEQAAEIIFSGYTRAISIDELDAIYGHLDSATLPSLDSDQFKGGDPQFYVINTAHEMGSFGAGNMLATMGMGDIELARGRETRVRSVRPLTDAIGGLTVTMGSRARLGDTLPAVDYTHLTASGDMPVRESGRYIRPTVKIAEDTTWTYCQGIEIEAMRGGRR
jgi:hypothetical protein